MSTQTLEQPTIAIVGSDSDLVHVVAICDICSDLYGVGPLRDLLLFGKVYTEPTPDGPRRIDPPFSKETR